MSWRTRWAAGVVALWAASPGHAATLDELKGHSFEIAYTRSIQFQDSRKSVEQRWVYRIYIGRAGTIFEYTGHDFGPAGSGSREITVAPEQARSIPRGRMEAWDMQGGNLTKIVQLPEGDVILTIAVDPTLSHCTFGMQTRLDPTTHHLVVQTHQGTRREIASMGVVSYVCTVKTGNVFAADQ
ncbi:MAG TPA: hypothetical protein VG651_02075 [Stellaceae bacterium]|nr:hypothetical protein [Stellaceae bacterium]